MQDDTLPNPRYATIIAYGGVALLLTLCWWAVLYFDGPRNLAIFKIGYEVQLLGCLITGVLLLIYGYLRTKKADFAQRIHATPFYITALTLLFVLIGAYNMIVEGINKGGFFVHRHDTYHYLLGVKYFPELQYNKLYACTVAADAESAKPIFGDKDKIRNLSNYRIYPIGRSAKAWKKECPILFGERWNEFKQDIETYKQLSNAKGFITDMGYNASPLHAFIMGNIANNFTLDKPTIRRLTLIDMSMICLMTGMIIWAGGWHIGLLSGIYFHNFTGDHFRIIGNAYGRYLWLFLLVFGICLLVKQRHRIAGFFMSLSMMITLFPGLFFVGAGLAGLREWIQTKTFPVKTWHVALGAITGAILAFMLGSIQGHRFDNFIHFSEKISAHSSPLTSKRVNLRYLLMVESEAPEDGIKILGNREKVYEMIRPVAVLFIALVLAICTHACWRNKLPAVDAAIFLGVLLMLSITPIVCYYFTASMLLILLYRNYQHTIGGALFMALPFLGMACLVWMDKNLYGDLSSRQRYHQMMNIDLTTYLLLLLGSLVAMWNIITPRAPEQR